MKLADPAAAIPPYHADAHCEQCHVPLPFTRCDVCGLRIESLHAAWLQFHESPDGHPINPQIVHRECREGAPGWPLWAAMLNPDVRAVLRKWAAEAEIDQPQWLALLLRIGIEPPLPDSSLNTDFESPALPA